MALHRYLCKSIASGIVIIFVGVILSASPSAAQSLTWDSDGNPPPTDGSGLWDTAHALWFNGTADAVWDSVSTAVFGAGNGSGLYTVTIDDVSGTVSAAGLTFLAAGTGNYTIAGSGTATLTLSNSNPIINLNGATVAATISAPIVGGFGTTATSTGSGLIINGGGTLTMSGANAYSGDTTITGNVTVNVPNSGSIGASATPAAVYVGYIRTGDTGDTSTLNLAGNSTLTATNLFIDYNYAEITVSTTAGSTLNVNGNNTLNVDNIIIDAGRSSGNTKGGDGTLKLGSGATLTLNGSAGAGNNVTLLEIANYNYESGGATSTGIVGTADFSAGTVNGTINTINIATGKAGSGGSTGTSTGSMVFGNGNLTAGTINIARTGRQPANGTLTLNAGTNGALTVGSLTFGATGATGTSTSTGLVNINGGTLAMTGDIVSNPSASTNSISAAINLAGGKLDMGGHNIGSAASPITLNATAGTLNNVNFINDSAGLTKTGGGTLTLTGTNAYLGDTNINSGTLLVAGAVSGGGSVNVNTTGVLGGNGDGATTGLMGSVNVSGGAVRPGVIAGDVGKLTMSAFNFHNGGLTIDLGSSFTSDRVNDTGALILGDSNASALTLNVTGNPAVGNYEIIDYGGALTKNADFAVTGPVGFNYALNYNTNGKVFLNVTNSGNLLTWNGAADQTSWDTSHANFSSGSGNVAYSDPKAVQFDDTAPANATTIAIAGTVSPVTASVNSSTRNFTFQGAGSIGGSANLSKNGSSTLTIVNNNTFSGTTTISSGTIQVGNGGTTGSLGSGAISVDGTLAYKRSDTVTLANTISGGGSLQQLGSGTLILTANNSYGATALSAGTLQIGNGGASGTVGTGPVSDNGTLAFNRSDDTNFPNAISGAGGINSMGPSVLTLSGNNSFAGPIAITSGSTLKVTDSNSLGATTGSPGTVMVNNGATLDVGANVDTLSYGNRVFHIQGTGVGDVGAIRNSTTSLQLNIFNFITLDSDATVTGSRMDIGNGNPNAVLNLNGHTLTTSMTTGSNHLFGIAGGNVTAGKIVVSAGALAVGGTATVLADSSGSNITFNSGTNAQISQFTTGNITRPLIFLGNNTIGNGAAAPAVANSSMLLEGNVSFDGLNGGALNGTGANPLVVNGNISDDSATSGIGRSVTKLGSHTLTFAGTNTYTGGTTLNAGTLVAGSSGAIPSQGNLTFTGAATLDTNGNNLTVGGLVSTGPGTIGNSSTTDNSVLTYAGSNANPSAFGGVIQDVVGAGSKTVSLTVDSGSLTLNGTNSYTGTTKVNSATLTLGAGNNLANTSGLILNGGKFGSGGQSQSLTNAPLTVTANSTIDMGVGSSTLSFANSNPSVNNLATSWATGTLLTINNWSGTPVSGGGADQLVFGFDSTGLPSAEVSRIKFSGFPSGATILPTGEVVPTSSPYLVGDLNRDGHVNAADIATLEQALTNLSGYLSSHSTLTAGDVAYIGDLNGDGSFDNADLQGMIDYLIQGHGSTAAVPEPATWVLLLMAATAFLSIARPKSSGTLAKHCSR